MTPVIDFGPGAVAAFARAEEAHHESRFGQDVGGSVVAEEVLEEEDVAPVGRQFDRVAEVEGWDVLVEVVEMLVGGRIGLGEFANFSVRSWPGARSAALMFNVAQVEKTCDAVGTGEGLVHVLLRYPVHVGAG